MVEKRDSFWKFSGWNISDRCWNKTKIILCSVEHVAAHLASNAIFCFEESVEQCMTCGVTLLGYPWDSVLGTDLLPPKSEHCVCARQ